MHKTYRQQLDEKLAPLRQRYLIELAMQEITLKEALHQYESGMIKPDQESALMSRAHKLAGSGAMFGFPAISETARAVEIKLQEYASADTILPLLHALLQQCEQARSLSSIAVIPPAPAAMNTESLPLLLSVDDDPAIHGLIMGLFAADARIATARDSREALASVEAERPDLIVLDDQMPGEMTGLQLLEHLGKRPEMRDVPVIMLTASAMPASVMRGLTAGAADYIAKPFDPVLLADKIRSRLKRLRYTILIVDDDPIIRDLLKHRFHSAGCPVLLAEDGMQALEIIRAHLPDAVVLDRMMPGLDGSAVLHTMREDIRLRKIPVLFLTAKQQSQDILTGFQQGVADYITKPFNPEEVLVRTFRLLDSREKGAA